MMNSNRYPVAGGRRRAPAALAVAFAVSALGGSLRLDSSSALAAAGKSVDQHVAFEPDGTVAISNVAGTVVVRGWDHPEVHIAGRLGSAVERLDVRKDGTRLVVKVVLPRGSGGRGRDADLQLSVPKTTKLEISTVSAKVESTQVTGGQRVNSVSGNVGLDVAGEATEVRTVSGDVTLRGSGQAGRVSVSSVSGDVRLDRGAGSLEANTVSGDLTLGLVATPSLRLRSTSGDMRITAASDRGGSVDAESVSGDVTLTLKSEAGLELEVESFGGDIGTCFGARGERAGARGPGTALRTVRGGGGSRAHIKTMSGDVMVCDR